MELDDTTRGAMPRSSARLGLAGRSGGPIGSWRLIPRDAEGNQSGANGGDASGAAAGTTGTTGGATPPPQQPPPPPATDDDGLGDAGKRAIAAEREKARQAEERARVAEAKAQELEAATQTDQEKSVAQARREAASERDAHWKARIRTAEVRGALRGAGIEEGDLELALAARQFADLKVDSETGAVEGIEDAVSSFKEKHPRMFAADEPKRQPGQGGPWGGAEGGRSQKDQPSTLEEAYVQKYERAGRV